METQGPSQDEIEHTIQSPDELAERLGFTKVSNWDEPKDLMFSKTIPYKDRVAGLALNASHSGTTRDGDESISLDVYFNQHWEAHLTSFDNQQFLDGLEQQGITHELIEAVSQIPRGENGFKRQALRSGGYNKIAALLKAIERSNVYTSALANIEESMRQRYEFNQRVASLIQNSGKFPRYTIINDTERRNALVLVDTTRPKKNQIKTMILDVAHNADKGYWTEEFQIGNATTIVDTEGNLVVERFRTYLPQQLPSTGQYPPRWARAETLDEVVNAALDQRQQIADELHM